MALDATLRCDERTFCKECGEVRGSTTKLNAIAAICEEAGTAALPDILDAVLWAMLQRRTYEKALEAIVNRVDALGGRPRSLTLRNIAAMALHKGRS